MNESEVVISISDTGAGIPADNLPYLFDEFYQVDRSLHRKPGGTGLGLAISKHFGGTRRAYMGGERGGRWLDIYLRLAHSRQVRPYRTLEG